MTTQTNPGSRAERESTDSAPGADAHTKAQQVAGQAQEQAQEAAGQAQAKLREQLDQRSSQLAEQAHEQASDLRSVSEALRDQGQGPSGSGGRSPGGIRRAGGELPAR